MPPTYMNHDPQTWAHVTHLFHAAATSNPTLALSALSHSPSITIMSPPSPPSTHPTRTELLPSPSFPSHFDHHHHPRTLAIHLGPPAHWFTALHWSIVTSNAALLSATLHAGMDVDSRDYAGYTALHLAALKDDAVATRTLLEWAADVDAGAHGGDGFTPLDEARWLYKSKLLQQQQQKGGACGYGYMPRPTVVWLLLENVKMRDWRDWKGVPLLHLAVEFGHVVLVEDLLDVKGEGEEGGRVDVDSRDRNGRTALHVAGEVGDRQLVRLLLEKGADRGIRDCFGRLALDFWAAVNLHVWMCGLRYVRIMWC